MRKLTVETEWTKVTANLCLGSDQITNDGIRQAQNIAERAGNVTDADFGLHLLQTMGNRLHALSQKLARDMISGTQNQIATQVETECESILFYVENSLPD